MSRHRIIRRMDYNEEYECFDEVYGRSLDDDNCISPTDAQQWIYNRAKGQRLMSSFLESHVVNDKTNVCRNDDSRMVEKDYEGMSVATDDKDQKETRLFGSTIYDDHIVPSRLNNVEREKLVRCMEGVCNVVGDTIPERCIIESSIRFGYDIERVLDDILKEQCNEKSQLVTPKQFHCFDKETTNTQNQNNEVDLSTEVRNTSHGATGKTLKIKTITQKDMKRGFTQNNSSSAMSSQRNNNAHNNACCDDGYKNKMTQNNATMEPVNTGQFKVSKEQSNRNTKQLYDDERGDKKLHLNMIVIGHVDAGKSTLMGHLLYDTGNVSQRSMHKYEQESKKIGKQSFMYAWVLDETSEERSRGITMDVANFKFSTDTKTITLIDAPGHKDFIPNMIMGATQADVALLVIDATRGEFESGFEYGGQTREHALLVRSLGIQQLGVIINKLDTVEWSKERFDEIVTKLRTFLKQAGYKEKDVTYVPCSGLNGENLAKPAKNPNLLAWYNGPNVLDTIDKFYVPKRPIDKPFRMPISDIYKSSGTGGYFLSGRIETGVLAVNDKILMGSNREQGNIKVIHIDDMPQNCAFSGDQVSIMQSGIDVNNITVGSIIYDPQYPVPVTSHFQARILVFNLKVPITKGFPVIMHHQSLTEPVIISKICAQINKSTGENMNVKPRCLGSHSCALVEIKTSRPICIENYVDYKDLGRFMLRVSGTTIAAGMVCHIYDEK